MNAEGVKAGITGPSGTTGGSHQWRGVIEEYRERLPVSDATPVITLREGGTPLVRSDPLSDETGCDVWLKFEGANPTGSFKDRGMTLAISKAIEDGAKAVVCASTGNTSASAAAYAAKAGITCAVLVPKGKIALGKMAQTLVHGARVLEVEGNFDAALELAKDLAEHYPVTLVNSVNPFRLEGQKTAAFEICDFLGRAPDIHCVPVGNAGNISSHWMGYSEYLRDGVIAEPPQLFGFQAQGAAPIVRGEAGEGPADDRHRDPDRQPGVVGQGGGGGDRVRRSDPGGDRPGDPGGVPPGGARGTVRRARERREHRRTAPPPRGRVAPAGRHRRLCADRPRVEGPGVGYRRRFTTRERAGRPSRRRRGARPVTP